MKKKLKWIIPLSLVLIVVLAFLIYTGIYYHADDTAKAALESTNVVEVSKISSGWFFDGPSTENALIFYPGAKVEETAYAPLMKALAIKTDVFIIKMPFRLAVLGQNKADDIIENYSYTNYYIAGHSMGGAMAAVYASNNQDKLSGLFMMAAYPTKDVSKLKNVLIIYGSNDKVLDSKKLEDGKQYLPDNALTYVIEGGNHASFGNYGEQSGDGKIDIMWEEQQAMTASYIFNCLE